MGTTTLEVNNGHLSAATYQQLRGRLSGQVARDPGGRHGNGTGLNLTMVVNDAWLKLRSTRHWDNSAHFFGAASRAVHQLLVDAAKRRVCERKALRVAGQRRKWSEPVAGVAEPVDTMTAERVLMLDELVRQITAVDEEWGAVVERKIFGKVPNDVIAEELGVCVRTVERYIAKAEAWISTRMPELAGRPRNRCRPRTSRSHDAR